MSNKKAVLSGDFLEIVLVLAKSWKIIVFGPLLCMAATAAFIYSQPPVIPVAFARVMAEPNQIALLADPAGVRDLLAGDTNLQASGAGVADLAALRIIPEPERLYRLELQLDRPERAVSLLTALTEGLVRETTVAQAIELSRRDITVTKLERALATVDRGIARNDPVIEALVDALSYVLTTPSVPPTGTSVSAGAVIVTEAPHVPRPPDARRHLLITLFIGFATTAVLIALVLIWSWAGQVVVRPENAETMRAIRAALPRFRGPRGS